VLRTREFVFDFQAFQVSYHKIPSIPGISPVQRTKQRDFSMFPAKYPEASKGTVMIKAVYCAQVDAIWNEIYSDPAGLPGITKIYPGKHATE
jgi:hypothetical protein